MGVWNPFARGGFFAKLELYGEITLVNIFETHLSVAGAVKLGVDDGRHSGGPSPVS
jgi:hypothetical protein